MMGLGLDDLVTFGLILALCCVIAILFLKR